MLKIRSYFIAFAVVFAISSAYTLVGIQDANAQAYDDLLKRIEALESKGGGNVTAPNITGIKIGLEIRHRFEARQQDFSTTGLTPTKSATTGQWQYLTTDAGTAHRTRQPAFEFTLQRTRLHFDADVNKNVRAFIKLQDTRTFGEAGTVTNLGRVDLLEGYAELRNLGDLSPLLNNVELRVGRWQAAYGNDRLIGTLNWTNEARAYDGGRLRWDNKKNAWIDVFAFSITENTTGGVSGGDLGVAPAPATEEEVLYGIYSQFKLGGFLKGNLIEPYMIVRAEGYDEDETNGTVNLTAREQRYTLGFRLDGRNISGLGGLDYTVEPAWQFGKTEYNPDNTIDTNANILRSEPIQAWAIYAGAGYTFKELPWSPRIGYAYVFASGDDDHGVGAAKTFDHLYPTGHAHLGYADYVAWQNIRDHQIHFTVKPTKKMVIDVKGHIFELDEEADSWYSVAGGTGGGATGGGGVIRRGADTFVDEFGNTRNVDDELGQEIDVTFKYNLFSNFGVVAGYSHFFAGDFIEDTGAGVDRGVDWFYLMTTMKF